MAESDITNQEGFELAAEPTADACYSHCRPDSQMNGMIDKWYACALLHYDSRHFAMTRAEVEHAVRVLGGVMTSDSLWSMPFYYGAMAGLFCSILIFFLHFFCTRSLTKQRTLQLHVDNPSLLSTRATSSSMGRG
ncbi:unnamed protein product, partial [Mesorhabditis spiculigera]